MPLEWTLLERSMEVGIAEASEKLFHPIRWFFCNLNVQLHKAEWALESKWLKTMDQIDATNLTSELDTENITKSTDSTTAWFEPVPIFPNN